MQKYALIVGNRQYLGNVASCLATYFQMFQGKKFFALYLQFSMNLQLFQVVFFLMCKLSKLKNESNQIKEHQVKIMNANL